MPQLFCFTKGDIRWADTKIDMIWSRVSLQPLLTDRPYRAPKHFAASDSLFPRQLRKHEIATLQLLLAGSQLALHGCPKYC